MLRSQYVLFVRAQISTQHEQPERLEVLDLLWRQRCHLVRRGAGGSPADSLSLAAERPSRSAQDANVESCPVCLACKIVKMTAEKTWWCAGVRDGDGGSGLGARMALGRVAGQAVNRTEEVTRTEFGPSRPPFIQ